MITKGKFLFLGTGGSMGVPVIGCDCAVCRSESSYNKRYRPSGLMRIKDLTLLIDCGPDFRAQMLKHKIKHLDGILFTHAHYDHSGGLDEIRIFNVRSKKSLPCLLSPATAEELKMRYPYIFIEQGPMISITSKIQMHLLEEERGMVDFLGIPVHYMTYEQGGMLVNGFRFGNFAYISDIRHFPETIYEDLKGVQILVVSCLRHQPSALHFNVEEAVEFAKKLEVSEAWFTHIAHELDHELTNSKLPSNYQLAYDGLEIEFEISLPFFKE